MSRAHALSAQEDGTYRWIATYCFTVQCSIDTIKLSDMVTTRDDDEV